MMNQMQGGVPTFENLLNKYASKIEELRNKEEAKVEGVAQSEPKMVWADEFEMPQDPQAQASFLEEVNVQENIIRSSDPRFSGNKDQDMEAAIGYLYSDQAFNQNQEQMIQLVEELNRQVEDGDLTLEEATGIFVDEMEVNFHQFFQ